MLTAADVLIRTAEIVAAGVDGFRFGGLVGRAADGEAGGIGAHARAFAGGLRGNGVGYCGIDGRAGVPAGAGHRGVGAGIAAPVESGGGVVPVVTEIAAIGGIALGADGLRGTCGGTAGAGLRRVLGPVKAVGAAAGALAVVRAAADVMVRAAEIMALRAAAGKGGGAVRAAGGAGIVVDGGRSTGGGALQVGGSRAGAGVAVGVTAHAPDGDIRPFGKHLVVAAGMTGHTDCHHTQNSGLAHSRSGALQIPGIRTKGKIPVGRRTGVLSKIAACRFRRCHRCTGRITEGIGSADAGGIRHRSRVPVVAERTGGIGRAVGEQLNTPTNGTRAGMDKWSIGNINPRAENIAVKGSVYLQRSGGSIDPRACLMRFQIHGIIICHLHDRAGILIP